jgi:two-component system repressor protein LuxO
MRGGARDFLPKPIGAKALLDRLEEALSVELPAPAAELAESDADFAGFIGRSPPMIAVYEQIRRVAPSRAPVFLTGESGTGKELAAEAIHALGGAGRPFVAINCSAIPRELMESEMFGHVRGAFTGATENRLGAVELASGGTLFLDELTEMDAGLQSKLLRFVQDGRFRRVGGSETLHVDVRIISATNRDPHAEVGGGRLRTDLFHRLHVLPVHLPALRERGDDIRLLAEAFLARFGREEGRPVGGFTSDAIGALEAYAWPGNVRELANAVHRAVVLGDGSLLGAEVLPGEGRSNGPAAGFSTYASQERAIVERAVAARNGNIVQAARSLEISPSTIYRKMQAWRDPG